MFMGGAEGGLYWFGCGSWCAGSLLEWEEL